MNWTRITSGNWPPALKGAALTCAIGLLFLTRLGDPVARPSFDLPFVLRADVPVDEVALIYMDDESHGRLRQPTMEGWDRAMHGQLIDRLVPYRPKAIVFDIWFGGRTTNDQALFKAIERATNAGVPVILAGFAQDSAYKGGRLGVTVVPPFKQVSTRLVDEPLIEDKLSWGVVQSGAGQHRIRREIFRNPGPEPTVAELINQLTRPGWSAPSSAQPWVNYYGPPGHFDFYSFGRVLDVTEAPPMHAFSNKVVFVGSNVGLSFTGGTGTDHFDTPWSWWRDDKFPGVDLNATAYLNLAHGDFLTRMTPWLEALVVLFWGLALGIGLAFCRPFIAAGVGLAAAVAVGLLACALVWRTNTWFAWIAISGVQMPIALGWSVLSHTRRLAVEKARLETQLHSGIPAGPYSPAGQAAATPPAGPGYAPAIPDHTLLRLVGKGAYGEIWLARNAIGTYHAVKILHRATFPSEEPFEREFKGIQKFMPISREHPGLVQVLHVGRDVGAGYFYYIMETADDEASGQAVNPVHYAPRNLSKEIHRRGRLPVDECLKLGLQLTSALEYLHGQGLIHRDIKPANIIFVRGTAKLADIGLVTEIAATGHEVTFVGTEGYMPPEGPGKPSADVFSLGKVLYIACTGLPCAEFPALPEGVRDWPDCASVFELNEIILKACQDDAEKRYRSATEMRAGLERLQTQLNAA